MNLKRYSIVSVLLLVIVGFVVYSTNGEDFTFKWSDSSLTLPVALWIPLFMALFYLFSLAYLLIVGFGGYFTKRHHAKDTKTILSQIRALMLGEKIDVNVRSDGLKEISRALGCASRIELQSSVAKPKIEEIDAVIDAMDRLAAGESIDIKSLKVKECNPLYIKNELNRVKLEPKYANELLKKGVSGELLECAIRVAIDNGDTKELKKQLRNLKFDRSVAHLLISSYGDGKIELGSEEIANICQNGGFERADYISIHSKLKAKLSPDNLISLYEKLCANSEVAEDGLLYTLLDLEMIERAKERVANSNQEHQKIKAFFALKDASKNYPFTLFF